jgi:cell division protease FtsH
LAKKNVPVIVFIDEIDALGRKRSQDGETSSSEKDATLNELLVQLDGFKTETGVFVMGATNRLDLLDKALIRPGRIDKRIFINLPDESTRLQIIKMYLKGKPYNTETIDISELVQMTNGYSCAELENILNEAMLFAIRNRQTQIEWEDLQNVMDKMSVGWQPTKTLMTEETIEKIAIHEMGHAIVGFLSKSHSKLTKVVINPHSPTSPGYTMFEPSSHVIHSKESLFEHVMILLAGRLAEEEFFGVSSSTTGARDDLEKALELAKQMIEDYGMGDTLIYPKMSEKYVEKMDEQVFLLVEEAKQKTKDIIDKNKIYIQIGANILKTNKKLTFKELEAIFENK